MSVLHRQGLLQEWTFKGGTSLRLCYNSSRLSEDLDFIAGLDFKANQISGLGDELKLHLEKKYGLNVSVHEPNVSNKNISTGK